jgi:hypothetical protein
MWLLRLPACAFVRVESVAPGSQACVGNPGNLEVTPSALAVALVAIGTGILIVRELVALARRPVSMPAPTARDLLPLGVIALAGGGLIALAGALPSQGALFVLPGLVPEVVALLVAIPLGLVAAQVVTARDARRFVVGFVVGVATWFAILYPNVSALPLPSRLVNAYQGILPTYLYPFQFPVNTAERGSVSLLDPGLVVLGVALAMATVVVGYAAWAWRVALAERAEIGPGGSALSGPGGADYAPGGKA